MQLKPEEISKVIRSQIKYYDNAIKQNETGTVLMVGDGIARASGLINCMAGELLEFEDGSFGMAQNLEENLSCNCDNFQFFQSWKEFFSSIIYIPSKPFCLHS